MSIKELITVTYHDLVVKKNTSKISVKEVCDTCHISRTTFYKYFKDCYEIIDYILLNDAIVPTYDLVKQHVDGKLTTINWYLSFYKHREFYIIAIKEHGQNSLFDTIIANLFEENYRLHREAFPQQDAIDHEYLSYKYASSQAMLLKKWMMDGMVVSPTKMADYFYHYFLQDK